MALYIGISQIAETEFAHEYEHDCGGPVKGLVSIDKATGDVTVLRECSCGANAEGHHTRVAYKLKKHWASGRMPKATCWAS